MEVDSFFSTAPRIPKDAIFALTAQYQQDESPLKVNLGQGAYRDNYGLPWVLPSVVEARKRVSNRKLDHEYLPILGLASFRNLACQLAIGADSFSNIQSKVRGSDGFLHDPNDRGYRLQAVRVFQEPVVFT